MGLHEVGEAVGRATVGQRTAGCQVGDEYFLVRAEDFGGFAHEMHAAHHQDVSRAA